MSLGVVIKGPEGIVLAADSRVTLEARKSGGSTIPVNFDNATKLLSFSRLPDGSEYHMHVGAVTYGLAVIGRRTAHSYIPEFEQNILAEIKKRLTIEKYSEELCKFFMERWKENMPDDYSGITMNFIVGGYDEGDAYGRVFLFHIPGDYKVIEQQPGDKNFGMTWGGQLEIACRMVHGFDPALPNIIAKEFNLDTNQEEKLFKSLRKQLEYPIPYMVLPLQDCVDLAMFLIRATMIAQRHAIGVRGVGGPIDVAVITRTEGLRYIQQKVIHGEDSI